MKFLFFRFINALRCEIAVYMLGFAVTLLPEAEGEKERLQEVLTPYFIDCAERWDEQVKELDR